MEHFVPAAFIIIVRDGCHARASIAFFKRTHSLQALSNWIAAAGENVNRKIRSHLPDLARISKPRECVEERLHRSGSECREAEPISDKGIHFSIVPAKPIKRSAGGLKKTIHQLHWICPHRNRLRQTCQAIQDARTR